MLVDMDFDHWDARRGASAQILGPSSVLVDGWGHLYGSSSRPHRLHIHCFVNPRLLCKVVGSKTCEIRSETNPKALNGLT